MKGSGLWKNVGWGSTLGTSPSETICEKLKTNRKDVDQIFQPALLHLCVQTLTTNLLLSLVISLSLTTPKQNSVWLITCRERKGATSVPAALCLFSRTYRPWHVIRLDSHLRRPLGYRRGDPEHLNTVGLTDMLMPPDEMSRFVRVTFSTSSKHTSVQCFCFSHTSSVFV